MVILLQFIGSILLVYGQIGKGEKTLLLENKMVIPTETRLSAREIHKTAFTQATIVVGIIYISIGYLIQLLDLECLIDKFLFLDSLLYKFICGFVLLLIMYFSLKKYSSFLAKRLIDLENKGVKGVFTIRIHK